jgi:syringomycin synthetase protein SyrE
MTRVLRLTGPLDLGRLATSINALAARHEAVRTTFRVRNGLLFQSVAGTIATPLSFTDLTHIPADGIKNDLQVVVGEFAAEPFNLVDGPLFRFHLVSLTELEYVLVLVAHHSVCDGESWAILIDELRTGYISDNDWPGKSKPANQYRDYSNWINGWRNDPALIRQFEYGSKQLSGSEPTIDLPLIQPRSQIRREVRGTLSRTMSTASGRAMVGAAHAVNVPLLAVVAAAVGMTLHRYLTTDEIMIGTVVANRGRDWLTNIVGLLMNDVGLRLRLGARPEPAGLLNEAGRVTLEAMQNSEAPFELVASSAGRGSGVVTHPRPAWETWINFVDGRHGGRVQTTGSSDLTLREIPPPDPDMLITEQWDGLMIGFYVMIEPTGRVIVDLRYNQEALRTETAMKILHEFVRHLYALGELGSGY